MLIERLLKDRFVSTDRRLVAAVVLTLSVALLYDGHIANFAVLLMLGAILESAWLSPQPLVVSGWLAIWSAAAVAISTSSHRPAIRMIYTLAATGLLWMSLALFSRHGYSIALISTVPFSIASVVTIWIFLQRILTGTENPTLRLLDVGYVILFFATACGVCVSPIAQ